MINFTSNGNSVSIEFIGNPRYLNAGTIEVPLNSLALEFDGSGLALFKKAANGDVLFQCFPSETNLATREAIETFYQSYMVGTGGGGSGTGAVDSVNGKTGVVVLNATDVGAVAKTDFGSYSATVQTALDSKANQAEFEAFSASVEADITNLEKQDTAIGSEIASHEQAFNSYTAKTDTAIAGKQDTLVSGANIKTINGQTLLGEGNIDIQGGGGASYTAGEGINISEANEISVDKAALAIPTLQTSSTGNTNNYIYSDAGDIIHCAIAYMLPEYSTETVTIKGRYWGEKGITQNLATLSAATINKSGVMSSKDKAKLISIPEASTIALKSEIPSLEGYLTKASADTVYQPIGDYVTGEEMSAYTYDKATIDGKITGGGTFDPTNYYTKTDVNGLLDDKVDTTAYTQYTGSVQTTLDDKVDTTAFTEYTGSVQTTLEGKADAADIPSLEGYLTKASADTLYATVGSLDALEAKDTELEGEIDANKSSFDSYTAKTNSAITGKQDTLVSGTNIKTINGESILGEGNITIQGGGGADYTAGEGITITGNTISVDKEALDIPTPNSGGEGTSAKYLYQLGITSVPYRALSDSQICVNDRNYYDSESGIELKNKPWGMDISMNASYLPMVKDNHAGLMYYADKVKLDGIPAEVYSKTEIDTKIGDIESLLAAI